MSTLTTGSNGSFGWHRLRWVYLPGSLLSLVLQRAPVLSSGTAASLLPGATLAATIRAVFTVSAAGAYHAMAGATQLVSNPASPTTATVGLPFTQVFSLTGAQSIPASYEITGTLPPGLSVPGLSGDLLNASSGTVTGTPAAAGSYSLAVRAWAKANKKGDGGNRIYTLTYTILPGAVVAPTLTLQPASQTVFAGGTVTLSAAATGGGTLTYQWYKDDAILPGATTPSLTLTTVTTGSSGAYRLAVGNAGGTTWSAAATLTVIAGQPPGISTPPLSQTVVQGAALELSVDAGGTPPLTYQWYLGGTLIPGATEARCLLAAVSGDQAGAYSVTVTNPWGTVRSDVATVAVIPTVASAITNVSVRTTLDREQILFVGFNVGGGSKSVLVRAVGPGLATFGVPATMSDPQLEVFRDSTPLYTNDNWGGDATLVTAFASVGAFGLNPGSLDCALLCRVEGGRTAQVRGPVAGSVLVEAYDTDAGMNARLTNISARNRVGTGSDVLIAGFVVSGSSTKTVLIRAVGPGLAQFGVINPLADPRLDVYSGATRLTGNDTWSPVLGTLFSSVGAFALSPGSKDAALQLSLAPGAYTVQVSGADGGTGEALVEVYEVQP